MSSAPVRSVRAILAGLVVAGTAAAAHWLAGGCVEPAALAGVAAGFSAIAWPLTKRRVETSQFIGLLMLGQVIVHVSSCCHLPAGRMLAAHVIATGISAVVLRRGESALWALVDAICLRLPRAAKVAAGHVAGPLISGRQAFMAAVRIDLAAPRGPPRFALL